MPKWTRRFKRPHRPERGIDWWGRDLVPGAGVPSGEQDTCAVCGALMSLDASGVFLPHGGAGLYVLDGRVCLGTDATPDEAREIADLLKREGGR